jgi:transcriptional regulator with XRE-family HTH domain
MSKKSKPPATVSQQLADAINARVAEGVTLYRVAVDSGVSQSPLRRFMADERSLSLQNVDRLAAYLDLQLSPIGRR